MVERADTPVIYLSTDAAESETGLLQSLVVLNGKLVPLVKRPTRNLAEKWDALLYRHGLDGDLQVRLCFFYFLFFIFFLSSYTKTIVTRILAIIPILEVSYGHSKIVPPMGINLNQLVLHKELLCDM